MSIENELAELSLVYHGQRAYVEELQQLVRELSATPVDVRQYELPELHCAYCVPFQDRKGVAHHTSECLVTRATALLSTENTKEVAS